MRRLEDTLDWLMDSPVRFFGAIGLGFAIMIAGVAYVMPATVCKGIVIDKRFTPAHNTWQMTGKVMTPVHHAASWKFSVKGEQETGVCEVDETTFHKYATNDRIDLQ